MSRSLKVVFVISCLIWVGAGCWAGYLVGQQQAIVGNPVLEGLVMSPPYLAHQPLREYICDKCREAMKPIQEPVMFHAPAMAPFFVLAPDGKPVIKMCSHELTELIVWAMDVKDGKPFYTVPRGEE